jgi:hypothetical protein
MPDLFHEAEEAVFGRLHHTSAAPAAAAVNIEPTPGGPVSFITELKNDGRAFMAKLESVDEDVLGRLELILANPKTAEAFNLIASVAHVDPGPYFDGAVVILKVLAGQPAPSGVPQFTPAGPQVAGQA